MADAVSGGEVQAGRLPPKRRRILDPSAVVPAPVYSNKVSSSLQLEPTAEMFSEKKSAGDDADSSVWSEFSFQTQSPLAVTISDSDSDEVELVENRAEGVKKRTELEVVRSPSPPPVESLIHKQSNQVKQKIREINRKLQAVNSLLSPEPQGSRSGRCADLQPPDVTCNGGLQDSDHSFLDREIPLKIRCRTSVHKIPVLSSTLLSDVVTQLSVILNVPPPRLLLMREEVELPTDSTVGELGLGIADIIDCCVMAAEDRSEAGSVITVRLQSKDRDSSQELSLLRDAPLGSIFSQYLSKMSTRAVCFQFDGSKVTANQTPAELDMEDGDIIEVWT